MDDLTEHVHNTIEEAEEVIADKYGATEVDVSPTQDGLYVNVRFTGFPDYESALDGLSSVARNVTRRDDTSNVNTNIQENDVWIGDIDELNGMEDQGPGGSVDFNLE